MTYRLRLLGTFELSAPSGAAVPLAAKKSQALLAMLALAEGAPVSRSRLMAVLWGDRGEEQARNSLRQALAGLRKTFAGHGFFPLRVTEDSVATDPAAIISDLGDPDPPPGEFLEGLHIPGQPAEEWLLTERQRLAALRADRLARRIAEREAAGDADGVFAAAESLLGADPLSEPAHRALMRGHAARGDRIRALRQFQICREALRAELGIEPDAETLRLEAEIRAGAPASPPMAAAAPAVGGARPTVAVLPFANLSADPEQEYFSDGITDDIITELGRFRNVDVIARISAFHFKGHTPLATEIGEKLGADFAVQGSIRKAGNRVRITVQLAETATGRQLWAEHFDRDLTDIFAVQDEITDTIAGMAHGRLEAAGEQRTARLPPERLGAYDLCLRAKALTWKFKPDANAAAQAMLERAIVLDPQSAVAHAYLSTTYHNDWMAWWVVDRAHALDLSLAHARTAVDLDRDDGFARWRLGEVLHYRWEVAEARSQFEAALRLNPNDAVALCVYGYFLSCLGEDAPAMVQFERAERIDPFDSYIRPWLQGMACYFARRYEETLALLNSISDPHAEILAWLAATNAQLGRAPEALRQIDLFLDAAAGEMPAFPGRHPEDWREYCTDLGAGRAETGAHLFEGLRKAWPAA